MPPVLIQEDVLPPMPQANVSTKEDVINTSPVDSGSGAPENDIKIDTVMPAVVTSGPKKKFAGGKVIATILGLFLLVGGIGAGVFLTGQNQDIRENAADACSKNGTQSSCNSSCSPLKGDPPKSYECKWYSESSSCGESGQECGIGGGGTDPVPDPSGYTTRASCEASGSGGQWCSGTEISGSAYAFCMKNDGSQGNCNSRAVELGYSILTGGGGPGTGGWRCIEGQGKDYPYVAGQPCVEGNSVQTIGCTPPSCFCGTIQIDNGCGGTAGTYQSTCSCGTTNPPVTNPPAPQCITKPFVSGTVTAKADGKTTVKCTFSEKVDCIAPTVNGQGSPCTFTGWEGNTGVYDCNIAYSSVTTVSCNTFPGSASNCCAGGNAVPVPLTPTAPPVTDTPPVISAVCQNIKAYNSSWAELTAAQLSALKTGNTVNFCVTGSASSGSFDKAKFTINGVVQAETTTKRPGGEDFCQSYTIPANTTSFGITAQINHVKLGWK
jgi:hypothetical protein